MKSKKIKKSTSKLKTGKKQIGKSAAKKKSAVNSKKAKGHAAGSRGAASRGIGNRASVSQGTGKKVIAKKKVRSDKGESRAKIEVPVTSDMPRRETVEKPAPVAPSPAAPSSAPTRAPMRKVVGGYSIPLKNAPEQPKVRQTPRTVNAVNAPEKVKEAVIRYAWNKLPKFIPAQTRFLIAMRM